MAGLGGGLALAAMVARLPRRPALALAAGVLVAGVAGLLLTAGGLGGAQTVAEARGNLASPDRSGALHAALRLVAQHPLTGTGPGNADLRWRGHEDGSQLYADVHNEYLQVATGSLGLVGLVLLALLLVAMARLLWRTRPTGRAGATWAGVVAAGVAFAVHSGLDFVLHLPAIVLSVMLLVGLVLPAPDTAPARHAICLLVQEEEPDENQAAHGGPPPPWSPCFSADCSRCSPPPVLPWRSSPADCSSTSRSIWGDLVARGAAVDVPVEVTCNATNNAFVQLTVTQKAGSGVAEGFGSALVGCTGSNQQLTVRVQASGGKTFKQGTAVATAFVDGCNNVTCAVAR